MGSSSVAPPSFAARFATRLLDAPVARRERIIRSVSRGPVRLACGLAVRAHLLRQPPAPAASALEQTLRGALAAALHPSELVVHPIGPGTPPAILDAVRLHDAVHPVRDEADLARRLESDRAIFILVHPLRPAAVIAFVEVAFTRGLPSSIETILDPSSPVLPREAADHAVFYGISNIEPGAAGLTLGTTLIDRALALGAAELPEIRSWATLSPIPGLRRWLTNAPTDELADLAHHERLPNARERPLLGAAAERFILEAKTADGRPSDPVARFHLGNGARFGGVVVDANHSRRAVHESAGAMASYVYKPTETP